MRSGERSGHLTAEKIQEFLDDALPVGERAHVRTHLDSCPRCRSELETWSILFQELKELPPLSPSPEFSREVLSRVPTSRRSLFSRLLGWLGLEEKRVRRAPGAHPPADRIQDYLEGLLPAAATSRVDAHLDGCASCRERAGEWERVLASLNGLSRMAPSPGFSEAVMARVRVPAPASAEAPVPLSTRIEAILERLTPRSRKGWALVTAVAAAPATALTALAWFVLSHPALTPATLVAFAWSEAMTLGRGMVEGALGGLLESVLLFQAWNLVAELASTPILFPLAALALSLMTLGSGWILYRNLFPPFTAEGSHGHAAA